MSITATTLLRCKVCHRREQPDRPSVGPRATGAENQRTRDGVQKNVYHVRCSCGHQWYSATARAKTLHDAVDAKDRKRPARKAVTA